MEYNFAYFTTIKRKMIFCWESKQIKKQEKNHNIHFNSTIHMNYEKWREEENFIRVTLEKR